MKYYIRPSAEVFSRTAELWMLISRMGGKLGAPLATKTRSDAAATRNDLIPQRVSVPPPCQAVRHQYVSVKIRVRVAPRISRHSSRT